MQRMRRTRVREEVSTTSAVVACMWTGRSPVGRAGFHGNSFARNDAWAALTVHFPAPLHMHIWRITCGRATASAAHMAECDVVTTLPLELYLSPFYTIEVLNLIQLR